MMSGLDNTPARITQGDRLAWLAQFDGICLSSDAYIPFRANIDRAQRSNVQYIAQTGGAARDGDVTTAGDEYGIVMVHTGLRLFVH